jgi:hypothetical protein
VAAGFLLTATCLSCNDGTPLHHRSRRQAEGGEGSGLKSRPSSSHRQSYLGGIRREELTDSIRLLALQPKFLTKAQRAQIALEKRQQEIDSQKDQTERAKREREDLERKAEEERRKLASEQQYGRGGYGNGNGFNVRGGYGGSGGGRGGYDRSQSNSLEHAIKWASSTS